MTTRILFLITQDLQSPSGLGRYFPLATELVRKGFSVQIAALHSNLDALEQRQQVINGVQVDYVAAMHVKKQGSAKTYYTPLKMVSLMMHATWQLTRFVLTSHADIIHVCKPHPMNGISGVLGKWAKRRSLYLDCDDYEAASNRFSANWQRRGVEFFEDHLPRWTDRVTFNTYFTYNRLRKLGIPEERFVYLPNGVDRERFFKPSLEKIAALRALLNLSGKRVIVYVGSLSLPSHPVDLLIEAFGPLYARFPDTRLLIVGGGEDLPDLQRQAKSLGLEEAVCFTGRIPSDDVPLYYRLGEVSVDPVYDTQAAAGRAPLKMFESWASGVPFVTQDVGDRRLLAGEPPAALLVRPGSPHELTDAMEQVLIRAELAAELRERGFRQVQEYFWDRIVERTAWIYNQEKTG